MRIAITSAFLFLSTALSQVAAFPSYGSLAGLSEREIHEFVRTAAVPLLGAQPAPGPLADDSVKLVADAAHPYIPAGPNDIRGPCPGLNTLASHGYLPRNGIATPQQIVTAVQEGFNMGNDLAVLVTWGAFIVDGNHLTNLMSIGEKTGGTGPFPPAPAIVGGLNTHGVFEGDASTTRGDFYFGNNFSFNETLFEVFLNKSTEYGGGAYNLAAAAEVRWARLQDSRARNPAFTLTTPRFFTVYAESAFPVRFFVDGRAPATTPALSPADARGFFEATQFPAGFHRRNGSFGIQDLAADINALAAAHPIAPGHNEGAGNYVLDPEDPGFSSGVNVTTRGLYPNATGALRKALQQNAATFYQAVAAEGCTQVFPWGQ
ncbi:hypothetical protein HWV62_18102 [Athelia sp. TMB]|nr:hypothetical protein HWV62_18102 [Athelia sp. TMB]